MKLGTGVPYKLFGKLEFRKNRLRGSHTLLKGGSTVLPTFLNRKE